MSKPHTERLQTRDLRDGPTTGQPPLRTRYRQSHGPQPLHRQQRPLRQLAARSHLHRRRTDRTPAPVLRGPVRRGPKSDKVPTRARPEPDVGPAPRTGRPSTGLPIRSRPRPGAPARRADRWWRQAPVPYRALLEFQLARDDALTHRPRHRLSTTRNRTATATRLLGCRTPWSGHPTPSPPPSPTGSVRLGSRTSDRTAPRDCCAQSAEPGGGRRGGRTPHPCRPNLNPWAFRTYRQKPTTKEQQREWT